MSVPYSNRTRCPADQQETNRQNRKTLKQVAKKKENEFFSEEELFQIDKSGLPEPVIYTDMCPYRSDYSQTIRRMSRNEGHVCSMWSNLPKFAIVYIIYNMLTVSHLPPSFSRFFLNLAKNGEAPVLHKSLLRQYDVSKYFPNDSSFKHLLLYPRGLEKHSLDCEETSNCCCFFKLHISEASATITSSRKSSKICYSSRKLSVKFHCIWLTWVTGRSLYFDEFNRLDVLCFIPVILVQHTEQD